MLGPGWTQLEQLTRDHSLVSDALLERPDLSSTDLAYLPKNVITRALGIGPTVDVDVRVVATDSRWRTKLMAWSSWVVASSSAASVCS